MPRPDFDAGVARIDRRKPGRDGHAHVVEVQKKGLESGVRSLESRQVAYSVLTPDSGLQTLDRVNGTGGAKKLSTESGRARLLAGARLCAIASGRAAAGAACERR